MHKYSKKIKLLDLFSGTGGFSKGFIDAGYEIEEHYFSEIDKHAIANYKYNFKKSIYVGDVKGIDGRKFKGIDIITFGSPCQDFSIAGKRKGLGGDRSSLLREAIRIVEEAQPRIFIWENVKGTFSSNAREDFWAILKAFTNIRGYRYEWQLLNTKWVLPHNRERIYFVGLSIANTRSRGHIFPLRKNDLLSISKGNAIKRFSQAKDYCSTIKPKFGHRATDTFIAVGDFRYDSGFRKRKNNVIPTLTAKFSKAPIIKVKNNTRQGYKLATVGDSINYNYLKSNRRRGRVGKRICQTLDTSCNIATLSSDCKIRRLTEIECERLQGFPDNWTLLGVYNNSIKKLSKTNRYKLLGNAVTISVVACIANKLKQIM